MNESIAMVRSFFCRLCEPYIKASTYERWQWATLVCVFSAAFIFAALWFQRSWIVGVDTQVYKCIDATVYIVSKRTKFPVKGEIFAIEAYNSEPVIKNGTLMAKYIRGVPGDKVTIDPDLSIYVNDKKVGKGFWHIRDADPRLVEKIIGTRVLKDDEYWVMGT